MLQLPTVPSEGHAHFLTAICGAAAVAGLAEVLFGRLAAPGLAFDGHHRTLSNLGSAAEVVGERAAAAAAILMLTASVWFVVARARRTSVLACAVLIGVGSSVALAILGVSAGYVGLIAALLGMAAFAMSRGQLAAGIGAFALLAQHAPLAADAVSAPLSAAQLSLTAAFAEGALLLVAPALVIGVMRHSHPSRVEWSIAAVAAALATGVLMAAPTRMPMIAFGSLNLAMAMPVPFYALSAAALGLIVSQDVRRRRSPARSIALVMLFVAAVQPSMFHHAVAGLIAIALLIDTEVGEPGTGITGSMRTDRPDPERAALAASAERG